MSDHRKKKKGRGRPPGTGQYGESTKAIQLPDGVRNEIKPQLKTYAARRQEILDKHLPPALEKDELEQLGDCWTWLSSHLIAMIPLCYLSRYSENSNSETCKIVRLPMYAVAASPDGEGCGDEPADYVDLGSHLVGDPKHTFLAKVSGDSMVGVGIEDGHILVVEKITNRGITPKNGEIVIAALGSGAQVVKLFHQKSRNSISLLSANKEIHFPPIEINEDSQEEVFIRGIVRHWIAEPESNYDPRQWLTDNA